MGWLALITLLAQALGGLDLGALRAGDRWLADVRLRLLAPQQPDSTVVIIDIDERSVAAHGRWPWRRSLLAEVLAQTAGPGGARLVGLDLLMAEPDNSAGLGAVDSLSRLAAADHDAKLQQALAALRQQLDDEGQLVAVLQRYPVVLGFHLSNEPGAARIGQLPAPWLPASLLGAQAAPLPHWSGHGGNLAHLQAAASLGGGHLNALVDSDGQVRRVPLLVAHDGGLHPTLALVMARALLAAPITAPTTKPAVAAPAQAAPSAAPSAATTADPTAAPTAAPAAAGQAAASAAAPAVQPSAALGVELAFEPANGPLRALWLRGPLGQLRVPVDAQGAVLVPYSTAAEPFKRYSAADLLANQLPPDALRGKVVLVGVSAPGLVDQRATPVDDVMQGTLVHAHLLAGLLQSVQGAQNPHGAIPGRLLVVPDSAALIEATTLLALGGLLLWALPRLRLWQGGLLVAALLLAVLLAQALAWRQWGWVLPLASSLLLPLLLLALQALLAYRQATGARQQLAQLFGQYVPPELVAEMGLAPNRYTMRSRSAELTVLFADVQGFSAVAERMAPAELGAMMNLLFSHLTDVVLAHRGTLDKYIGDAVMAFWGAPLDDPEHARHAVAAALAMRARLPALHAEMASHGWPALAIHIGINTGQVVVGDMGSRHRRAYTVMGDAVNLAARLQALASRHALGLVLGDSTWRALALGSQAPLCLALGAMDVKGRDAPVLAWHPLIWPRDQPVPAAALVQDWDALRAAVSAGRHAEASALLQALQRYSVLQPLCRWQRALLQASGGAAQAA